MTTEIRSILGYLTATHSEQDVAMVVKDRKVFYSATSRKLAEPFESPVVTLLQQIFERFIDHSFFILRQRIFTNYQPYLRDLGMVKVVAKRISYLEAEPVLDKPDGYEWICLQPSPLRSLSELNQLDVKQIADFSGSPTEMLGQLVKLIPRGEVLHDFDREIAAILVDEAGRTLSYGLNSNHLNKTLHAEINLVQRFIQEHKRPLPLGSKIYVTHKPCKMCASMIYDCSIQRDRPFVFYGQTEKGSLSSSTILDEMGLNHHEPQLLQTSNTN